MYLRRITGEQLVREISKRQDINELADSQSAEAQQRKAKRMRSLSDPVRCRVSIEGGKYQASAFLNFSDTGALLKGPLEANVEQFIEVFVAFADTGETFSLVGRIVRQDGHDFGVQFKEQPGE